MLYATRKINLKHLTSDEKSIIKELCILSKDVYNEALNNIMNCYSKTGKILFWIDNVKLVQNISPYKLLGTRYQAVIKQAESNFRTYTTTSTKMYGYHWQISDQFENTAPPSKKKVYFPIISDNFEQKNGLIKLPFSLEYSKLYKPIYFKLPPDLSNTKIISFTVRPKYDFSEYELQLTYQAEEKPQELDFSKCLSIDLGICNLATCVDDVGESFIIDGKYLKSIIQGYEKTCAQLNALNAKHKIKGMTHKQKSLLNKYNNRINDYLNKSVKFIIDYCLDKRIGNLVVGYGYKFKGADIGKETNQIFSKIPYFRLFQKLRFKCKKYGIKLLKINEAYTSKASFFDDDEIPSKISRKKYIFSGLRVCRGLYISKDGTKINSDLNASLNIMKKSKLISPDKIEALKCRGSIAPPRRIRILSQSSKEGKNLKPNSRCRGIFFPCICYLRKGVGQMSELNFDKYFDLALQFSFIPPQKRDIEKLRHIINRLETERNKTVKNFGINDYAIRLQQLISEFYINLKESTCEDYKINLENLEYISAINIRWTEKVDKAIQLV